MTAPLTDPAFVVHVFGPATGYDDLRPVWTACADALGMTAPIPSLGLPVDLPANLPRSEAVAARQAPDQAVQAIVRRNHDTLILSVALFGDWDTMQTRWTSAADNGWSFGEAWIYTAAGSDPGDAVVGPSANVEGHTLVWEASGAPDDRRLRRFIALSQDDHLIESDAWLWSRGDERLPPFARYLLHTAKIRYQLRVRDDYDEEIHLRTVTRDTDALLAEARNALLVDSRSLPGLLTIRARLAAHTVQSTGLTGVRTRLTEMSRTVEIAAANARPPSRHGLFADDLSLAEWFSHRLADDTHYLTAASERVHDIMSALSMAVEAALDQRREQLHAEESAAVQRKERLNLLQTAIIGSTLMILAAVQAFQYRLPLPPSLQAPLIAVLGTLALLLATITLWTRSPGPAQIWTGRLTTALASATVAWLVTTVVAHLITGHPSPVHATLLISSTVFCAAFLATLKFFRYPKA
ncbi:CATRA conflict system CASPASE/TPR repeat-associated protein [Streptosporangium longisporum]|uniref:Uncharacterized protein n=1 Tax=Streptosporangium longisporum TaxID=46187 RepID=A0ABP6KPX9_9ACTN